MSKQKFTAEYEIKASKKMLFPYLSTSSGLSEWYADEVKLDEDKNFNFIWNGEAHKARMISQKTNSQVKFEFITDDKIDDKNDPSFVEFKLDMNELTESVYLKVIDYSDTGDEEEMKFLWTGMVNSLKEIVGG